MRFKQVGTLQAFALLALLVMNWSSSQAQVAAFAPSTAFVLTGTSAAGTATLVAIGTLTAPVAGLAAVAIAGGYTLYMTHSQYQEVLASGQLSTWQEKGLNSDLAISTIAADQVAQCRTTNSTGLGGNGLGFRRCILQAQAKAVAASGTEVAIPQTYDPTSLASCLTNMTACKTANPVLAQAIEGAQQDELPYDDSFPYDEVEASDLSDTESMRAWARASQKTVTRDRDCEDLSNPRDRLNNESKIAQDIQRLRNVCDPLKFICSTSHSFWDVRSIMRSIGECNVHLENFRSCQKQMGGHWPEELEHTIDPAGFLRRLSESGLLRLFSICRYQGREILKQHGGNISNIPGKPGSGGGATPRGGGTAQ